MIRWDRIDSLRLATLLRLRDAHVIDEYYLSGGTALALHLGHRVSLDLDLFSRTPRAAIPTNTIIQKCQEAFGIVNVKVGVRQKDQVWLNLNGVQTTFLAWPFSVKYALFNADGVAIADPRDILAQKAYAIGRRVAARDYVDIACGLRAGVISIDSLMHDAERVFVLDGTCVFDRNLFLQQLVYTDDLIDTDTAVKTLHEATTFNEITGELCRAVVNSTRKPLLIPGASSVAKATHREQVTLKSWPNGYIRSSTGLLHLRATRHSKKALCGKVFERAAAALDAVPSASGRFCHVCRDAFWAKQNDSAQ